jgi:hypothetical protein
MIYSMISWTRFKALKTSNAAFTIYYTQVAASPNEYIATLGNQSQCQCDILAPADVTDFETNYKASATAVITPNDAFSLLDAAILLPTNVLKTGSLVTTAVTVDQVVLTYTVTAGKTFYVKYIDMSGAQTTPAGGTSTILGTISMETPSGTKTITRRFIGGGGVPTDHVTIPFDDSIPVAGGVVIRVVVTPSSTTSMTWIANFGGYEA